MFNNHAHFLQISKTKIPLKYRFIKKQKIIFFWKINKCITNNLSKSEQINIHPKKITLGNLNKLDSNKLSKFMKSKLQIMVLKI